MFVVLFSFEKPSDPFWLIQSRRNSKVLASQGYSLTRQPHNIQGLELQKRIAVRRATVMSAFWLDIYSKASPSLTVVYVVHGRLENCSWDTDYRSTVTKTPARQKAVVN